MRAHRASRILSTACVPPTLLTYRRAQGYTAEVDGPAEAVPPAAEVQKTESKAAVAAPVENGDDDAADVTSFDPLRPPSKTSSGSRAGALTAQLSSAGGSKKKKAAAAAAE